MDTTSDLLANVDYVFCLDSLGKTPIEGSAGDKFFKYLVQVFKNLYNDANVELVHKKSTSLMINFFRNMNGSPTEDFQPSPCHLK